MIIDDTTCGSDVEYNDAVEARIAALIDSGMYTTNDEDVLIFTGVDGSTYRLYASGSGIFHIPNKVVIKRNNYLMGEYAPVRYSLVKKINNAIAECKSKMFMDYLTAAEKYVQSPLANITIDIKE